MKKTKKNSIWGGRMQQDVSNILQAVNSSIDIDKRLFQEDNSWFHCSLHHVSKAKNY